MITKETIIVQQTKERVFSRTCDICGLVVSENTNNWGDTGDPGNILETEIKMETGNTDIYDYHGSKTVTSIDICPDCFEKHLIPWVKSFGKSNPFVQDVEF